MRTTAQPTFTLPPVTESMFIDLIGEHKLTEVDVPELDPEIPAEKQVIARWLVEVRKAYPVVRLFIDGGGKRWMVARDATGMMHAGSVEGIIGQMSRNIHSGLNYGPTADKRAALGVFLAGRVATLAPPTPNPEPDEDA